jgi:nucleoside-diphosphate-sugar epimerase
VTEIFVTGATGFLGSYLVERLLRAGHRVRGSGSMARGPAQIALPLGAAVDPALFAGVDTVFHAAWDLRPGSLRRNIDGTRLVRNAAEAAGVGRQIFIGSDSGHARATSEYGRGKHVMQEEFLQSGLHVARPGLVIGPGGLFLRLATLVARLPIVPVPVSGGPGLSVTALDDFLDASALLPKSPPRLYELRAGRVPLPRLMREIADAKDLARWIVPIPAVGIALSLRAAEAVGIRLPVGSGNLAGFLAPCEDAGPSDLEALLAHAPLALPEAVRRAVDRKR